MKGPLVAYRLIFLILNVILAYKIFCRVINVLYDSTSSDATETKMKIDWNSVDLKFPPKLHSSVAERLRLNEFLAAKQYDCKEQLRLGNREERYILCGELRPFKSAASISGDKLTSGDLEGQLGAERWIIFAPEGSPVVEKLGGDVEVNYMTELPEWDHWHTWDFEQVLKKRKLDVVKFDLYTSFFKSDDQTDVIRKLVPLMDARHLLLTIQVGQNGDSTAKWYQLLYWLYFEHGYALVGAIPNGVCGEKPQRCKYRVSMAKVGWENMKSAPVFGMGSPLEEKRRLIRFITEKRGSCREIAETEHFPQLCGYFIHEVKTFVYVTYKLWDATFIPREISKVPKIHVVSPIEPSGRRSIIHHSWVISNKNNTTYSPITFKTIDDVLKETEGSVDLLVLDADGGEWEILPQLLTTSSAFKQIVIRGKIFPEENENYRRFYFLLNRLTQLGFEANLGYVSLPTFSIVFLRT